MADQNKLIDFLRKVTRSYVAGVTEAVLDPNILEKEEPFKCLDPFFMRDFGVFEKGFVLLMIELGIVKKSQDPRNIRYITKILRHAFRKMWAAIEEQREDEELLC